MSMKYTMPIYRISTAAPSTTLVSYAPFTNGLIAWDTSSETTGQNVAGGVSAWTISNIVITLATAPGGAASYTFQLRINGLSATGGSGVISGSNTTVTIAGPFTINPGDVYNWQCTPSGGPAGTGDINQLFDVQGDGQMLSLPSTSTHTDAAGTTHFSALDQRGNQNTEALAVFPIACAGVISDVYINTDVDPGNGKNVVLTLRKAGVSQSLTVTLTGNGTTSKTAHTNANPFTVSPGDRLCWQHVVDPGANTVRVRIGALFTPTTGGQIFYMFEGGTAAGSTQYCAGESGTSVAETRQMIMPACTVSNMYVDTSSFGTPAAGQLETNTLRKKTGGSTSDTSLQAVVTGTATTANDTTHSASFLAGDLESVRQDQGAGATSPMGVKASMVFFFPQSGAIEPDSYYYRMLAGGINSV